MTTALHWHTPEVVTHDPRGLAVRHIAYLRNAASGELEPFITRQTFDVNGHLIKQRDARLTDTPKPNLTSVYGLRGQPVKVDSVDSGNRWFLAGLAGEILQRWNGRDGHWRTFYDNQLRVVALEEIGQGIIETLTYATALTDPNHNLRGQLIKQVDSSSELVFSSYSLLGQVLRESRTITDAGSFLSSRTYSPLGTVLTQTDAGDHQQRMNYDITGQLQQVQFRLTSTGNWQPVLEGARYNAAGQIIEQQAGNNVVSHWTYDEADGRLETLNAGVPGQNLLQQFQYSYDRVGNLLRIDDLAFKPVCFRNQLIDGHREFSYNSLYQLTSATGHDTAPTSDLPGRPAPSDPNNPLNYKQIYTYDPGGNLIKLIHERAVGGYTHEMFIDLNSNRGVRWKNTEPDPNFDTLFDRHGNLNGSSPGRPLHWNSRDQLACATLVERDNGPNDEETYHYSQGVRVLKRHEWQASTLTHFHQVIYLPGLEIRTRDNGEELHVITLPGGRGSVRCLHWESKKPDGIDQDQLRYSLDDHLGSSLMELDRNARLISHEGYYPYGSTAWLTAVSALEVSYKTIRYSGKEMDECGLYYYGARYYAPWLQRWVSADPAGYGDGPNLYAFVGNSPLRYFDDNGEARKPSELRHVIVGNLKYLSAVNKNVQEVNKQLDDLSHPSSFRLKILKNFVYLSGRAAAGFFSAFHVTGNAFGSSNVPGELQGLTLGNFTAETSNATYAAAMSPLDSIHKSFHACRTWTRNPFASKVPVNLPVLWTTSSSGRRPGKSEPKISERSLTLFATTLAAPSCRQCQSLRSFTLSQRTQTEQKKDYSA
jgi:insecticidal toxin complex protein TccC